MKKFFGVLGVVVLSAMLVVSSSFSCEGPNCPKTTAKVSGESGLGVLYDHGNPDTGGYAGAWSDNSYEASTRNNCGPSTAFGMTGANGNVTGSSANLGPAVGLSHSRSTVNSMSMTLTSPRGMNHSMVSGGVEQGNWANAMVDRPSGYGYASGGNQSGASYEGHDRGRRGSSVSGGADTCGLTLVGAHTVHVPGATTSVAGGITANTSSAWVNGYGGCIGCGGKGNNGVGNGIDPPPPGNDGFNDWLGFHPGNPGGQGGGGQGHGPGSGNHGNHGNGGGNSGQPVGSTSVWGNGEMYTGTFAQLPRNGSWAGTSSYAAFSYENQGRNYVSGAGVAAGVGYSHVQRDYNSVTANSCTTSFAHAR